MPQPRPASHEPPAGLEQKGVPPTRPPSADPGDGVSYDQAIQLLIPGYGSLARLAVALLSVSPLATAPGSAVLVAGCGTGAELIEARSQRPDWNLTALDPSAAMLAVARQRIGHTDGIDWEQARVEDLRVTDRFHGALAVLVLQSLPDDGSKLRFLTALADALKPGGQLVLVDLMQPERSTLRRQTEEAWHAFQRASGLEASTEILASIVHGLHPIGIGRLTSLADAAGFSDPAPVFRALAFEGFLLQRRS